MGDLKKSEECPYMGSFTVYIFLTILVKCEEEKGHNVFITDERQIKGQRYLERWEIFFSFIRLTEYKFNNF
jgi:hypothetical protein